MITVLNCRLLSWFVGRYRPICWLLLIQDWWIASQNIWRFLGTNFCIIIFLLLGDSICWWCAVPLNVLNAWLLKVRWLIVGLLIATYRWLIWKEALLLHLGWLNSWFMSPKAVLCVELSINTFGGVSARSVGHNLCLFSNRLELLHLLLSFSALWPVASIGNKVLSYIHFVIQRRLYIYFRWSCFIHWFYTSDTLLRVWLILVNFIIHRLHQSIVCVYCPLDIGRLTCSILALPCLMVSWLFLKATAPRLIHKTIAVLFVISGISLNSCYLGCVCPILRS